jgi:hypothetical protein
LSSPKRRMGDVEKYLVQRRREPDKSAGSRK